MPDFFNFIGGNFTAELAKNTELQYTNVTAKNVSARSAFAVESLLDIKPQIQEIFNRNEVLLDKEIAAVMPEKFGVLGHIDPTRNLLLDAMQNIANLRGQLIGAGTITDKAQKLLADVKARNQIEDLGIKDEYWLRFNKVGNVIAEAKYQEKATNNSFQEKTISLKHIVDLSELDDKTNISSSLYSTGLFSAGNSIRADIRDVDQLHGTLMNLQASLNRALARKKNELVKLDEEIPMAQRKLANLNQERIKALGESKMVYALVEENWRKVEQDYIKREKILTRHRGIYFARVNETPYGKSVLDVDLRYGRIEDLVPGTAISHLELPDEIEPYIEAIVDMPVVNWKPFNDSWHLLPARPTVTKWLDSRRMRLNYLAQQPRTIASKFVSIMNTHQAILQDYARFPMVFENSLQAFYRQAIQIISLEDLLTGTPHQLRGKAQEFRNQLDQATHLILATLHKVKPSIRMDWATAAELDQLDLRNPQSWPGMEEARAEDISTMRTLVELINWWWRQLNDNASSASATAVRNLLRAALMVAVGDDPKEMVHGYLQVIPNLFRTGDLLRASLNRHAAIGTELNLVNERDELVGKLRVEDADERGTVVSIAQIYKEEIKTSQSQYSLVGINAGARSFV